MKKIYILIIFISILYLPSLSIFFSGDDWFHLRVSNITSPAQFFNFFSFARGPQSIAFYRPLSTQTFFFLLQKVFGLNSPPYHVFVLICFVFSVYIFYRLAEKLLHSGQKAFLATALFGTASSNVTRIYFLSHFQEISLVILSLLSVLSHKDGRRLQTILFFILALASKETAIVIPAILILLDWSEKKIDLRTYLPFIVIATPYLYLRFFIFGAAIGDTYGWSFSLLKAANTLMWYVVWSIGAPELLLDYIGSGLRPIPRFFSDFPNWWHFIIWPLLLSILLVVILFLKKLKSLDGKIVFFVAAYILSLLPVLFLPHHKFAVELGLPLVWFSLAVTWLLPAKMTRVGTAFVSLYLILNLSMNFLTAQRHYSVGRSKVSKNVYSYVMNHYPVSPSNSYFEFVNDSRAYTKEWGSSKQISNSIQGSEMFRLIYEDPDYKVYFEDIDEERPARKLKISLSTKSFLQ